MKIMIQFIYCVVLALFFKEKSFIILYLCIFYLKFAFLRENGKCYTFFEWPFRA